MRIIGINVQGKWLANDRAQQIAIIEAMNHDHDGRFPNKFLPPHMVQRRVNCWVGVMGHQTENHAISPLSSCFLLVDTGHCLSPRSEVGMVLYGLEFFPPPLLCSTFAIFLLQQSGKFSLAVISTLPRMEL